VFEQGVLCSLAVDTAWGPHLTPVVYALDGGRLWVTTARRSVKAQAWRRDRRVAGLITHQGMSATFCGVVTTYDAFDPASWPAAVVTGPWVARAAMRFSMKNARFFAGYAVDARRVPFAWSPPGRVFAAIRPTDGAVLDDGPLWGRWSSSEAASEAAFDPPPRRRALDLEVPGEVRTRLGRRGAGALALRGATDLTVLPVEWRRVGADGSYEAILPSGRLDLAGAGPASQVALTVDRASRWRAADMVGMLLQGSAEVFDPRTVTRGRADLLGRLGGDERLALVRVTPRRIVWWEGWTSGAVTAGVR
jgi:hypothetical protein